MSVPFKIAIAVSVVIHSLLFIPAWKIVKAPLEAEKPVIVDYLESKEPEINLVTRHGRPVKIAEAPKAQPAGKADLASAVEGQEAAAKAEDARRQAAKAQAARQHAAARAAAAKREVRELAKSQEPLRNTRDYINYYQLIREKIRQELKDQYKKSYGEGDVVLLFVLDSDGSLAAVDVEETRSTKDAALAQLAIASLKDASPFPHFPKELSVPKMSFDLTVSFKKQ